MPPLSSSAGRLKFSTILFLILVVGAVYAGFQILPVWLDYYNFKEAMTQRVQIAQMASDTDIRKGLIHKAEEMGLPLTEEDILVERTASEVTVSTSWTVEILVWGFYSQKLTFSPVVVQHLR